MLHPISYIHRNIYYQIDCIFKTLSLSHTLTIFFWGEGKEKTIVYAKYILKEMCVCVCVSVECILHFMSSSTLCNIGQITTLFPECIYQLQSAINIKKIASCNIFFYFHTNSKIYFNREKRDCELTLIFEMWIFGWKFKGEDWRVWKIR